jgi:tricorn protease
VEGIVNFMKGFYSQSGKEAHIIDERFNGGGWIPTFFIEALIRQFDTAMVPRYGPTIGFPTQSLAGPKAMLINEYAGSGGDMFPWLFKNAKVGPLIGMRTWGGLVGISGGLPLVDGGSVTAPAFGIFDTSNQKWIAENTGVDPDIKVDNDPGVLARGEDAQLKAAFVYLMAEIKAGRGAKPIIDPKFPKAGSGLGGN